MMPTAHSRLTPTSSPSSRCIPDIPALSLDQRFRERQPYAEAAMRANTRFVVALHEHIENAYQLIDRNARACVLHPRRL